MGRDPAGKKYNQDLQVLVILGQGGVLRLLDVLLDLLLPLGVHCHLKKVTSQFERRGARDTEIGVV